MFPALDRIIAWLKQPGLDQLVPMPNIPGLPPFESGTPRAHAPTIGEHTREVLKAHGYSDAQIDDMAARKVVKA